MKLTIAFAAMLLTAGSAAIPALADQSGEQAPMRRALQGGSVRSSRDIEREVLPTMPGMQYLGPEYYPEDKIYRLKFIHDGHVVYVDVDARSGRIKGRSR